jgi:hypothetical protein
VPALYNPDVVSLVVIASIVLASTFAAAQLGALIGRTRLSHSNEAERSQLFGIEASLVGLLALLLGFSFAMGETRYDLRRQLVVDEANAIGTSRLRSLAIPDEPGAEVRRLLLKYVDARLAIARAHTNEEFHAAKADGDRLQREVWSVAAAVARQDPRSVPAGLLLQSLNEMIDLDAKRLDASRNHIPFEVLSALILVAAVAMGWVGACFASSGQPSVPATLLLCAVIAFVITVIVDLDKPRTGLIRISATPLVDVRQTFQ